MTYVLSALEKMPIRLWALDTATPYSDQSGYETQATATGTPGEHPALAKGMSFASVFGPATATFPTPVFTQGSEHQPFTLVSWVRVISTDDTYAEQQVLGHAGEMDGLLVNGSNVGFSMKYLTAPEVRIEVDILNPRAVMLTAVYSQDKVSLYVDDELEEEVILSDEQLADTWIATDGNLSLGATLGTSKVAVNGVAVFPSVLSGRDIAELFYAGRDVVQDSGVPVIYGGRQVPLSLSEADIFLNRSWSSEQDWSAGENNGLVFIYDQLRPQLVNDVSTAGEWYTAINLSQADTTSIFGVIADWNGKGAVVEASLDGATWTTINRNEYISLLAPGFDPTDQLLEVRVSFPGGITSDDSYLDNLNFVGLRTGVVPEINGRAISVTTPGALKFKYPVAELQDNWGAELYGGSLTIGGSVNEPVGTREAWVKPLSAVAPNFGNVLADTTYINGEPADLATLPVGQWSLIHIVHPTSDTTDWVISGDVAIGTAATYLEVLDGVTIENIYGSYVGKPVMQTIENSTLTITDIPEGAEIYAHDWSIQPAG